ncbi:hypothetical protein I3760_09G155400 [Carya illinoinensis]|nr:hypothetical protein I3760_09G155400 [Carya illinoinensis]
MAEGTRGNSLKAYQEMNQKQQEAMQQQLDDQQQSKHVISDRLDQMIDIIRTLLESRKMLMCRFAQPMSISPTVLHIPFPSKAHHSLPSLPS